MSRKFNLYTWCVCFFQPKKDEALHFTVSKRRERGHFSPSAGVRMRLYVCIGNDD